MTFGSLANWHGLGTKLNDRRTFSSLSVEVSREYIGKLATTTLEKMEKKIASIEHKGQGNKETLHKGR